MGAWHIADAAAHRYAQRGGRFLPPRAMSTPETPQIDRLQAALDRGDLDDVRRTLLALEGREAALLERSSAPRRSSGRARQRPRGRRRGKLGKVIVLPGIMGTELDSVDRKGDVDRIWIHFFRLLAGRIRDLELTPAGEPASAGIQHPPRRAPPRYVRPDAARARHALARPPVPLRLARGHRQESATRLDAEVTAFGAGEPGAPRRALDGRPRLAALRAAPLRHVARRWTTRRAPAGAGGSSCSERRTVARSRSR